MRLGQVGVLGREHDRPIPEILAALFLSPGMLPQPVSHVVTFADVDHSAAEGLRVIAEQKVDAGPRSFRPPQQGRQI